MIGVRGLAGTDGALPTSLPLIRPKRSEDEGPRGYLLRLAEDNRVDVTDMLLLLSPGDVGLVDSDGDAIPPGQAQRAIGDPSRFCPRCLRSRQRWHHAWEIPCADACSLCGAWLVDTCSVCQHLLTWRRPRLMYCGCGALLSLEQVREAPASVRRLAASLASLNRGGAAELAPLAGLRYEQAFDVAWFLGCIVAKRDTNARSADSKLRPLSHTWSTTSGAAEVLADWPRAMWQVLDASRNTVPSGDRGSLLRSFPAVYASLYRNPRRAHMQVIRDAFEAYVLQRWPGQIANRHRRLEDREVAESTWLRLGQAARLAGVPVGSLRRMVDAGEVEFQSWVTARGRRFVLLRRQSIEALQYQHGAAIDLSGAAMRLGVHESRLVELLPWLCPRASAPPRQGGRWIVPQRWVARWECFVESQPSIQPDRAGSVTLAEGLRYWFPNSRAVADFLLDVESGSVRPIGRVLGLPGLSSLVFDQEATADWLSRRPARVQTLSLRAAADILGVKEEVAYFLARSGLLKTHTAHVGRRRERHVGRNDLDEFQRSYVLAAAVARNRGTSARAVRQFLDSVNVVPVAGPGVNSCRQLIYRRGEVEHALLALGLKPAAVVDPKASWRGA